MSNGVGLVHGRVTRRIGEHTVCGAEVRGTTLAAWCTLCGQEWTAGSWGYRVVGGIEWEPAPRDALVELMWERDRCKREGTP